jgi:integral membrane protein
MKHPVSFLRVVTLLEAISFLILLFIAMPLKYYAGMPAAVKIVGMTHGVLFVLFCVALYRVMMHTSWPFKRAAMLFVASLVPFVPFFIDRRMRAWAAADSTQAAA